MNLLRGVTVVEKFDIIVITESWMDLDSKHLTTEFEIEGYNLFYFDRQGSCVCKR